MYYCYICRLSQTRNASCLWLTEDNCRVSFLGRYRNVGFFSPGYCFERTLPNSHDHVISLHSVSHDMFAVDSELYQSSLSIFWPAVTCLITNGPWLGLLLGYVQSPLFDGHSLWSIRTLSTGFFIPVPVSHYVMISFEDLDRCLEQNSRSCHSNDGVALRM